MSSSTLPRRSGRAVADLRPLRPSLRALEVTQDRLAERRFLEGAGARVAALARGTDKAGARGGRCRGRRALPTQGGDRRLRRPEPGSPGRAERPRFRVGRAGALGRRGRPAPRAGARLRLRAVGGGGPGPRRPRRAVRRRAQPARCRDPVRDRRAGARAGDRGRSRRAAQELADPPRDRARRRRHPDRRAVPARRWRARRERARPAGPQQRPLDDRGRRDEPVRAAHPGDLRPAARRSGRPRRRRR